MRLFSALFAAVALTFFATSPVKAADPIPKVISPVHNDNVTAFSGFLVQVGDDNTTDEIICCRVANVTNPNNVFEVSFSLGVTDGSGTIYLPGEVLGTGTYEIFVYSPTFLSSDTITVFVP